MTGQTNSRKYYKLLQDKQEQEGIDNAHSYITGRLDETMFAGSDGCDYLEIVYKVIKKNGDYATNYRFYTGIQFADVEEATESNGGLYNI